MSKSTKKHALLMSVSSRSESRHAAFLEKPQRSSVFQMIRRNVCRNASLGSDKIGQPASRLFPQRSPSFSSPSSALELNTLFPKLDSSLFSFAAYCRSVDVDLCSSLTLNAAFVKA